MVPVRVEIAFWAFGLALLAIVAVAPATFFRVLGRGRVTPAPWVLSAERWLAVLCVVGLLFRILRLAGWAGVR